MKESLKALSQRLGMQIASTARSGIYHCVDLDRIRPLRSFRTIFDVGAHIGETSAFYARQAPNSAIYAFEPIAHNYQQLVRTTAGSKRIRPVHTALAATSGERVIHHGETSQTHSLVGSVNDGRAGLRSSENIQVQTIDEFCASNTIEHIDLLKTDTEGYDMEVLRGASGLFEREAIDFVYAEAGFDPADVQHTSFERLFAFLTGKGFGFMGLYELSVNGPPRHIEYCNALFSRI